MPAPKEEIGDLFKGATVVLLDGSLGSAYAALWAVRRVPGPLIAAYMVWDGSLDQRAVERVAYTAERAGIRVMTVKVAPFPVGRDGAVEGLQEGLIRACVEHGAVAIVSGCTHTGFFGRGRYGSTARDLSEIGGRLGVRVLAPSALIPVWIRNMILNAAGIYTARLLA